MRRQRSRRQSVAATVVLMAAATAGYYLLPVPGRMQKASWALMFSVGAAVLGVLILTAISKLMRAGANARIRGLVLLHTLTVLFFSWSDDSVAELPGQFVQLTSKTDSLYFNVSTLATVGFGDVHPAGQLARAAVTLQIVFNLVFIGAAVSMISGYFRTQAHGRMPAPGDQAGQAGPPGHRSG